MKSLASAFLAVLLLSPTAKGGLIVYEGFNYPAGDSLPGQNGGSGWLGEWIGPNLGGAVGSSDLPFSLTNGLSWTNGPGYVAGIGASIFDSDDGGSGHSTGHGDARQWFDPGQPLMPFESVYGTNIWFSCLVRYDVISTSGGIVVPFGDTFQPLSGIGVSLKGGAGGIQVYIRQHGFEMATNAVNYLQGSGDLTNVALVVGRFRLGPPVVNPILQAGNDRLDVWLNQSREPTNDSALYMAGFSAFRTSPYSQGYLYVRTGGNCQMVVDEIKIGTMFADVVPPSAASPNPRPPPPLVTLSPAGPVGLQLNAGAGTTNQYNEIVTMPGLECSWIGATPDSPASYSFTITNGPARDATNFLVYAWWIPSANGFISAEFSNPNVLRFALQSLGNGNCQATLAYKVYSAYDQSMFDSTGYLCTLTNAPFVGRWSITATNDTDLIVTAPNGAQAIGSMPSSDSGVFSSQVQFFLGVNPGSPRNLGKFITLSSASIGVTNANTTNYISSDFTTGVPLDSATWSILADDPASIIMMPADSRYRATWRNAVGAGVGPNALLFANSLVGSPGTELEFAL